MPGDQQGLLLMVSIPALLPVTGRQRGVLTTGLRDLLSKSPALSTSPEPGLPLKFDLCKDRQTAL